MSDKLKAAVDTAYVKSVESFKTIPEVFSDLLRALADEPEVIAALRIDDEVHAADIRDILRALAEIVR